jgi:hypothetical protein
MSRFDDDQGYDVTLLAEESGPTEEVGLRGIFQPSVHSIEYLDCTFQSGASLFQ